MTAQLHLPQVSLCAATSVNLAATVQALARCLESTSFAKVLLFTDGPVEHLPEQVEILPIPPLRSTADYSRFVLHEMVEWIETNHCMIVQWDGFIINPHAWDPTFLEYDYIGAPWPQFQDAFNVGNGGFSLRSRRLMEACNLPRFVDTDEAEDVVIARRNRGWMEDECGLRFADQSLASRFSFERSGLGTQSFGFHGAFNLPRLFGADGFWEIYSSLDEASTIRTDFWPILRQVVRDPGGLRRAARMIVDKALR